MSKNKTYLITFVKTVRATVEIEAGSPDLARLKFNRGQDWENEKDLEASDVEFQEIEEL